ncbi:hypothetical protein F5Y04DRAFT_243831 [Hypomontagnella monticulosa]|nr:hypothetical protein F5Y04DRAFT_243831 [Hypomontagnella monticulosa]
MSPSLTSSRTRLQKSHTHVEKWSSQCQAEDNSPEDPDSIPVSAPESVDTSLSPSLSPPSDLTSEKLHRITLYKFSDCNYRDTTLSLLKIGLYYDDFPGFIANLVAWLNKPRQDDLLEQSVAHICKEIAIISNDEEPSRPDRIFDQMREQIILLEWQARATPTVCHKYTAFRQRTLIKHPTAYWYETALAKPTCTFGYDPLATFPELERDFILSNRETYSIGKHALWFPYMAIIVPDDEESYDSGLNHALTAASSCIRLNSTLLASNDNLFFSVVVHIYYVGMYVSWFDDAISTYHTKLVSGFTLENPSSYVKLRRYIFNIQDWAKTTRLQVIRDALWQLANDSPQRK